MGLGPRQSSRASLQARFWTVGLGVAHEASGGKAAEASCFSVLGQVLCFRGPVNLPLQHTTLHPKATLSLSGCPLSLLDHFVQAPSPDWGQVAGEKGMLEPSCIPAPQFLRKRQLWGLLWAAHS